ncbi:carbonic anhydrase [Rhodoferax sp.]|uniref:carbonic anhydrase n=1 Tax=Rhodoferax sp. TaxID=50421 RepID=UPI0025E1B43E|nr:carbonic anhydrase [Rhodoferax sp.]
MTTQHHPASSTTALHSLNRLKAGNARFLAGTSHAPTLQSEILSELAQAQQPYATILSCSDSRVPPELVFDAWLGELFIIRVAGNVLGPTIAGSLQYAHTHLHTPLFVVMGHEGCGAIQAAVATKFHEEPHPERIADLLKNILPALDDIDPTLPHDQFVLAAVEANVRHTVQILRASPAGKEHQTDGEVQVLGAVYSLHTGQVRFLED